MCIARDSLNLITLFRINCNQKIWSFDHRSGFHYIFMFQPTTNVKIKPTRNSNIVNGENAAVAVQQERWKVILCKFVAVLSSVWLDFLPLWFYSLSLFSVLEAFSLPFACSILRWKIYFVYYAFYESPFLNIKNGIELKTGSNIFFGLCANGI